MPATVTCLYQCVRCTCECVGVSMCVGEGGIECGMCVCGGGGGGGGKIWV